MITPPNDSGSQSSGNWAWLTAIVAGAVGGIHAWFRKRPVKISKESLDDIYTKLQELEKERERSTRMWGKIVSIEDSISDIKSQMITRDDFLDFRREIRLKLDSKT